MVDTDGFSGIAADLVAGATARQAAEADGQLELDLLALMPPSRLPADQAEANRRDALALAAPRGKGRPLGAQNLLTRDTKRLIVRLFGDPLLESARWLLHTPAGLARELGCTALEAFDRQQRIREALAVYIHARMAPAGEDGRAVVPVFNLSFGAGAEALGIDATLAPWLGDPEIAAQLQLEQNQGVSELEPAKSHGESRTEIARP